MSTIRRTASPLQITRFSSNVDRLCCHELQELRPLARIIKAARRKVVAADVGMAVSLFPLPKVDQVVALASNAQAEASESALRLLSETTANSATRWLTGQIPVTVSFCAVLSQCCDVDAHQKRPPPCFTLCRMVPVPDSIKKRDEFYRLLKENVDPYGDQRSFFSLFYFGSHASLDAEYIADFGQVMSVRWNDYSKVLRRKVLQLLDIERAKFRVKAGAHFGRATDEELAAGTANPWRAPTRGSTPANSLRTRIAAAYRALLNK